MVDFHTESILNYFNFEIQLMPTDEWTGQEIYLEYLQHNS